MFSTYDQWKLRTPEDERERYCQRSEELEPCAVSDDTDEDGTCVYCGAKAGEFCKWHRL